MGLTERHLFENEDVHISEKPEDSTEIKYPCGQYQTCGCGLDFDQSKYKEDCYFYGETKDMGATIRYCTQSEIKWGYCPCEKCDKYISNAEASKIIRNYVEKRTEKEQEPKQIVLKKGKRENPDGSIDYFAEWYCPHCGKLLKHGFTDSWICYCCKCGQVVTWE